MSWSEEEGEFKRAYDVVGTGGRVIFGEAALEGEGRREKRDGEGEIKERY